MSSRMVFRVLHGVFIAGLILATATSQAGDDHDRARKALEAGEVLPLRTILQRIEQANPGQIMEVEFEHKDNRWLYEIKLLRTGGTLVKLKIDARNGHVLGVKDLKEKMDKKEGVR